MTDMCGWTNKDNTGQQWIRKNALQNTPIGPNVDGKNNNTGYYLQIVTPISNNRETTIGSAQCMHKSNIIIIKYNLIKQFKYI
jgi:hypothetical protein